MPPERDGDGLIRLPSALGAQWFRVGDMSVYAPWALFPWWFEGALERRDHWEKTSH